ncbi:hypothetical protein GCM10027596_39650 [Nocardioides korecus]
MSDQKHTGPIDCQGVVHLEPVCPRRRGPLTPVAHVSGEGERLPCLWALPQELHAEIVDVEVERRELCRVEHGARNEIVVLTDRVGEAFAGHHDDTTDEPEHLPVGEGDENDDHRGVEEQISCF